MKCSKCGEKESSHKVSTMNSERRWIVSNLCCHCYVMSGYPPADWHDDCENSYTEFLINKYGHDPRYE